MVEYYNKPLNGLHATYLFLMLGGLIPMLFNGASDFRSFGGERTGGPTIVYLSIHSIYFLLLCKSAHIIKKPTLALMPAFILGAISVSSYLWSHNQYVSLQQSIQIVLQILTCAFIFNTLNFKEFIKILSHACFLAAMLSMALILFLPELGVMQVYFPGVWQGIFIHKNYLGQSAVLFLIVFICSENIFGSKNLRAFSAGVAIILIIGSQSTTAYFCCAIVLFCFMFIRSYSAFIFVIFSMGLSAILLIFLHEVFSVNIYYFILELSGKDTTLTGRTTIWSKSLEYIGAHPILGYGMGGFWGSYQADELRYFEGWDVPHAHNGILELLLQIGVLGTSVFVFIILISIRNSVRLAKFFGQNISGFALLIILHTLVYGFVEGHFLRPNKITQILLYSILFYGSNYYLKATIEKCTIGVINIYRPAIDARTNI